jgi:KUP system potassium uptake protein
VDNRVAARIPGAVVFLASYSSGIPASLQRMVDRFHVLYETNVLLTVRSEHVPFVAPARRSEVVELGKGFKRVILRYGFMDQPNLHADMVHVLPLISCAQRPDELVYVLGRETFMATSRNKMGAVSESIFAFLSRNAKNATEYFGIPPEQVVELGVQIDL